MPVRLLLGGAFPVAYALGILLIRLLAHLAPAGTGSVGDLHLPLVALVLQHLTSVQHVQRSVRVHFGDLRHTHPIGISMQGGRAQRGAPTVGVDHLPGFKVDALQPHVRKGGALAGLHLAVLVHVHPELDSRKRRITRIEHTVAIGV